MPNVRHAVLFFACLAVSLPGYPENQRLGGVVLDEEGRPIAGATVLAAAAAPRARWSEPAHTETGKDGSFELSTEGTRLHVTAFADGFVPFSDRNVDPSKPFRMTLKRGGGVLEGVVRDGNTRDPIRGAIVEARTFTPDALSLPSRPRLGLLETGTDDRGVFRIEGVGPGQKWVSVSAPGYGRFDRNVAFSETLDVFLLPGSGVYGGVVDEEGTAVAGALVSLRGGRPSLRGMSFVGSPRTSDAEGRFAFLGVEPGDYRLLVRHDDYAPALATDIRAETDRDVEQIVTLARGTSVTGRVIDFDGRPLSARVGLAQLDSEILTPPDRDSLATTADGEGRFELRRVPRGDHELSVYASGYAPTQLSVSVARTDRVEELGDVVLDPGLSIRGRVVNEGGAVIPGVRITGFPRSSREVFYFDPDAFPETISEADGSFTAAGLEEGTYQLGVAAPGVGTSDGVTADAGDENVRIVLLPVGLVQGVVVDSRGNPLGGSQVVLHRGDGPRRFGGPSTLSTAEGSFLVEDVPVGEHVLVASAPGFVAGVVSDVVVKAGASTGVGTIRLARGGTVRGSVVDPSGDPVPGASVRPLQPGVRSFRSFIENTAVTSGDGSFELTGLPEGTIEVVANHPAFAEGRASAVIAGDATVTVSIRLSLGGRVEGYVRSTRGLSPGRSIVVIPSSAERRPDGPGEPVAIEPDGHFAVDGLPSGRAQVVLLVASGRLSYSLQDQEVDVRERETTWVELESRPVHVHGLVSKGGMPLAGAEIVFNPENDYGFTTMSATPMAPSAAGPAFHRAVSSEDGSYELFADRPGPFRVRVNVAAGGLPGKTVTVPDVEFLSLDLDFGGASISGRVVDAETGVPVGDARLFARPKDPRAEPGTSWRSTGSDGAFTFDVDPGTYTLSASADDYGSRELTLAVGPEGRRDVVVALPKGSSIRGVVKDLSGRGVSNLRVFAIADDPDPVPPGGVSGFAMGLPDGSYVLPNLSPGRYNVIAGDAGRGFAFVPGVPSGTENLELTLQPGGTVSVLVRDETGSPVTDAAVAVIAIEGRKVRGIQSSTDAEGRLELAVPAGNLLLKSAKGDTLEGLASVAVRPGAVVPAGIVLRTK